MCKRVLFKSKNEKIQNKKDIQIIFLEFTKNGGKKLKSNLFTFCPNEFKSWDIFEVQTQLECKENYKIKKETSNDIIAENGKYIG